VFIFAGIRTDLLDTMDNTELVQALARAAFQARGLGDATDAV